MAPLRVMEQHQASKKKGDLLGAWRHGQYMNKGVRERKLIIYALHRRMTGRDDKGQLQLASISLDTACAEVTLMGATNNARVIYLTKNEISVGDYEAALGSQVFEAL